MTLGEIKGMMVKHPGEYTNDADDPNVVPQHMPEGLHYITEAH